MNAPQLITFRSKLGSHALGDHYRVDIDTGFGSVPLSLCLLSNHWMDRPDLAARLEEEARVLDVLSHPHIIQAAGMTRIEGRPALVTEYTRGRTLAQLIQRCALSDRPIPLSLIASIGASVASAMHHACATLARVHTDLSAESLVLQPNGHVLLTRFEGSMIRGHGTQTTGQSSRSTDHPTAEYRAGATTDRNGDVHSLGTTLARLCTLKAPTIAITKEHGWAARLDAAPISADQRRQLTTLLERMLSDTPEKRPDWATIYHRISALTGEPAQDSIASFCRDHAQPVPEQPVEDHLRGSFWADTPIPPCSTPIRTPRSAASPA